MTPSHSPLTRKCATALTPLSPSRITNVSVPLGNSSSTTPASTAMWRTVSSANRPTNVENALIPSLSPTMCAHALIQPSQFKTTPVSVLLEIRNSIAPVWSVESSSVPHATPLTTVWPVIIPSSWATTTPVNVPLTSPFPTTPAINAIMLISVKPVTTPTSVRCVRTPL